MLAIGLLAAVVGLMWTAQSVILLTAGRPLRLRISGADMTKGMRQATRVVTNAAIAGIVVAYPLLRGRGVLTYYGRLLPWDDHVLEGLRGFAAVLLLLSLMYVAWLATDNVRLRIRHKAGRTIRRLAVVPLSAALGALTEELLFRGVVVADLLESFSAVQATLIGAALFAGAHYVRRVKRYWTIVGHVALGVLLCAAFVWTRSLWLPMGLHAAGILLTLGTRPFVRYTGPPWLVGASIFPYAGVAGMLAVMTLAASVCLWYGMRL